VKRLIGVNLAQLKRALVPFGIEQLVLCEEKRFSIPRKELICGFDHFNQAADNTKIYFEDRSAVSGSAP